MILYNIRYRGPLEYDKFALNILQFSNEINEIMDEEFSSSGSNYGKFIKLQQDIDTQYQTAIKYSEQLYLKTLNMKEN